MVRHLGLGEEPEGLLGMLVGVGDMHNAEELLLDRDRGVAVVNAPRVAVGERDPLDAGYRRVGEDLGGPFPVIEVGTERLRFDEQPRGPEEEQGVVDGVVRWPTAVFELDVLEVLDIPAERAEHGHDQRRLWVLLAPRKATNLHLEVRAWGAAARLRRGP